MLLDVKTLEESSKIHPQIGEALNANPLPPLDWSDYMSLRNVMTTMGHMQLEELGPANPEVLKEESIDITLRDGFKSNLKVFKPASPPAKGAPLIVFAFGGGFIGGDSNQGTGFSRMFVKAFGAVVVNISYRLAPENKFPCAQLDAWDSVKWIAEHASELGADPKQGFIMSGISAGGCVASTVVTKAINEPLAHPFTGQWLGVPTIMDAEQTPEKFKSHHLSLQHNTESPILTANDMKIINGHIGADPTSEWRSPMNSTAPISKQPKAFIQVDGMDPLRDDGLLWDELLKDAGVQTKCEFYPGCPHAHWAFFAGTEVGQKGIADVVVGMGWLLGEDLSPQDAMKRAL